MISRAWGDTPIIFLNHSKWSTYEEDLKKCSMIRQWLVMGSSTFIHPKCTAVNASKDDLTKGDKEKAPTPISKELAQFTRDWNH